MQRPQLSPRGRRNFCGAPETSANDANERGWIGLFLFTARGSRDGSGADGASGPEIRAAVVRHRSDARRLGRGGGCIRDGAWVWSPLELAARLATALPAGVEGVGRGGRTVPLPEF